MTDQNDTFDGANSYLTYYAGQWLSFEDQDIALVLEQAIVPTDLPIVKAPVNILSVTTNSSRNIPDLGMATVFDKSDPSPAISNNSTTAFKIGDTKVLWRATDSKGNIGASIQKVTVITGTPPPPSQYNRVVMVNFDDGYESIFSLGKPILDKYNIKTTQYIICGAVEKGDYMNWNMVHAMQADGQDIQAHTMDHLHSNHFSSSQLAYEFGQTAPCFANNGTSGVHMMALPYDEGYTNATVINAESKYYDMARGGTDRTFFLHCNGPSSTQTDCRAFDSSGNLNQYTRYSIRGYYTDGDQINDNYIDVQSFAKFIQEVGTATSNTSANSTEVPIVFFHRVVLDNGAISNPAKKGTTTILLDAEMKYLRDNNFKIWNTKDLAYDAVKNWFYFKAG